MLQVVVSSCTSHCAVSYCCSYNHSRDDEEVYKELLEIANEIIPQILRMEHAGGPLTRDPAAYALLLRFYDGLCCWEEDSQTPVMHITWATHMLSSIGKFDSDARTSVKLLDHHADNSDSSSKVSADNTSISSGGDKRRHNLRTHRQTDSKSHVPSVGKPQSPDGVLGSLQVSTTMMELCESAGSSDDVSPVGIDSQLTPSSVDKLKMNVDAADQLTHHSDDDDDDECDHRRREIAALAQACSESLLNPDFLRGGGEPFVKDLNHHQLLSSATSTQMDLSAFVSDCDLPSSVEDLMSTAVRNSTAMPHVSVSSPSVVGSSLECGLVLRSAKMSSLKQLLVAARVNSSAIKLQLTAQSQVARKPSAHIRRPLSTHFYSDDRQRRSIKRQRRAAAADN